MTLRMPARCAAGGREGSYASRPSGNCSAAAVDSSSEASPATTRSAFQSAWANATQASGPIPAGSPEVTMIRGTYTRGPADCSDGLLHLDFDEGLVAQPSQPK